MTLTVLQLILWRNDFAGRLWLSNDSESQSVSLPKCCHLVTGPRPPTFGTNFMHNWKSAQVINSHLVCDPTIRQPGFHLSRQQWSLLNRFRTEQGHCGACRRKWLLTDTDLCPCGETQTMSHIVESCPLTKLNNGLSRLHSADEDAVSWLTSYGSWHSYEKKKKKIINFIVHMFSTSWYWPYWWHCLPIDTISVCYRSAETVEIFATPFFIFLNASSS